MTRRTSGVGRYRTAERDLVTVGEGYRGGGPLVVVCHGLLAGTANYQPGVARRTLDLLADAGCVVAVADLGGASTWGNDSFLTSVHELINWARATYDADTSRVAFIGDSMGAMGALNWAWRNTAQFACASLRVPVVAADALHDRDTVIGTAIDNAYGGLTEWDAAKADRDPSANPDLVAALADNVLLWWSTDDPTVIPADIASFTDATGVRAIPLGAVQHDEAAIYGAVPAVYEAEWIMSRLATAEAPTHRVAVAEQERWLTYMRSPIPSSGFRGGDVTDAVVIPTGPHAGKTAWIGADWFSGSVDDDDTYGGALPFRNGLLLEQHGAFTGQVFASGTSGEWIAPNQTEHPDTHYWPIAATVEGDTLQVGCWLVGTGGPYGDLADTHIVSVDLADLVTVTGVAKMNLAAETFFVDGFLTPGDGWTYIYGEEFIPAYGAHTPAYGEDLDTDVTRKRVARCPAGTVTVLAGWEWWSGSAWVSGIENAATLKDTDGQHIEGDAGVCKISGGYLLAAHQLVAPELSIYQATRPQGPWEPAGTVPAADMGATWYGGRRIGQLTKLLPHRRSPAGHVMSMTSMNLIGAAAEAPLDLRDIRTLAPRFEAVPIP